MKSLVKRVSTKTPTLAVLAFAAMNLNASVVLNAPNNSYGFFGFNDDLITTGTWVQLPLVNGLAGAKVYGTATYATQPAQVYVNYSGTATGSFDTDTTVQMNYLFNATGVAQDYEYTIIGEIGNDQNLYIFDSTRVGHAGQDQSGTLTLLKDGNFSSVIPAGTAITFWRMYLALPVGLDTPEFPNSVTLTIPQNSLDLVAAGPATTGTPEPSTWMLLAGGAAFLLSRRRLL